MSQQPLQGQSPTQVTPTTPALALEVAPASDQNEERKNEFKKAKGINKFLSKVLKCLIACNPCHTPALLDPIPEGAERRKTLVLDLDETLIHSTPGKVENNDEFISFVSGISIEQMSFMKRPFVDEFLERVGKIFEVVIFTAGISPYARAAMNILDKTKSVYKILTREHCNMINGVYVKNLARLGRDIKDIILVDNSANSFLLQPDNAYHIESFFDNKEDRELEKLLPFLEYLTKVDDVRPVREKAKTFDASLCIGEQQPLIRGIDSAQITLAEKMRTNQMDFTTNQPPTAEQTPMSPFISQDMPIMKKGSILKEQGSLEKRNTLDSKAKKVILDGKLLLTDAEMLDDIVENMPKDQHPLIHKKNRQQTLNVKTSCSERNYEERKYKSLSNVDTEREGLSNVQDDFEDGIDKIDIEDLEENAKVADDTKYFPRGEANSPLAMNTEEFNMFAAKAV